MATYNLLPFRVRVLCDEGKGNTGTIIEHELRGYSGLITPGEGENPSLEHDRVFFLESGTEKLDINGTEYALMHMHNILAYLTDE